MISRQGKIECKTLIQKVILKAKNGAKHRNASILTFPGELFDDIGDYFHEHSVTEEENTFIFQNTHDWIGYLFSKKEYVEYGGYELTVSFFHTCGEHVYNEMKDLLNPMDEV